MGALKNLRESEGMTQQELAHRSGLAVATVSNIERGQSPNYRTLTKLATGFNMTVSELTAKLNGDAAPANVA